jgi:hypothetical protein
MSKIYNFQLFVQYNKRTQKEYYHKFFVKPHRRINPPKNNRIIHLLNNEKTAVNFNT